MPLEAGTQVNVGIRPVERPQSSGGPDRIGQRTGGSAAEASEVAWEMLRDAATHEMPVKGTSEELVQIRERRSKMTDGYGLLNKRHNH